MTTTEQRLRDLADPSKHEDADNHAHLTFYDQAHSLSFRWGGGTQITVGVGGYGEPTRLKFPTPTLWSRESTTLAEFEEHIRSLLPAAREQASGLPR